MNTVTVIFIPCNPAPINGYNLKWRVKGSSDPYTDEGNFTGSPIVFTDSLNPDGTCYEGILQSDCTPSGESGTLLGNPIAWQTVCEESGTVNISGNIEFTARGIFVFTGQSIPCDVTFPIDGKYDDGGLIDFSADVTVLSGATSGSNTAAVPAGGVIDCIKPTTAGGSTFVYSTLCGGVTYIFTLVISTPC